MVTVPLRNWPQPGMPTSCASCCWVRRRGGDGAPGTARRSTCCDEPAAVVRSPARSPPCCCAPATGGNRVTAKLIAAIAESGTLTSAELDELADSLLSDEVIVEYPLAWVSERWIETDPTDGTTRTVTAGETMTQERRRLEPPLRRWAATRALRGDPARLAGLLGHADALPPRHRDAVLHGMLDAAGQLDESDRRQLVHRALRSGIARVRRAALDRLCELDSPQAALRRARRDADRTVRAWRPPRRPADTQPLPPGPAR